MAYQANNNRQRRMPSTRESFFTEFGRADGHVDVEGIYAKVTGSSQRADIDVQATDRKTELSCGCYWPEVEVGGVCAECVREGSAANVCKTHVVVCSCGTPCCWKHSHPIDDQTSRLCNRCHLRQKNELLKAVALEVSVRLARGVFIKQRPDSRES